MSWFSEIRSLVMPKKEVRQSLGDTEGVAYYPYGDGLLFGDVYNRYNSTNLSAVFRCIDLIADGVACLPIMVCGNDNEHFGANEKHSLNTVLKAGDEVMNRYQFMRLLIQSVLTRGNGFALIERAGNGTVTGLRYLENGEVVIHYNKFEKDKEKRLFYTTNYTKTKVMPRDMIHLVKYSKDGVNGQSVLSYAARTLELSHATENSATNLFKKGCNLSGVLTVQGQLTKEQRQQIHQSWETSMTNGGSGLAILQGNMDYKSISLNAKDSQMLESRLFNLQEIARFFGVNPIMLGDLSHTSYNSIEQAQTEFLLHTLMPYIIMVEEEFTKKLFSENESGKYRVELDQTAIIKTDKKAMAEYYSILLDKGILCVDEVRKEMGYSEIGMTEHIIPYTKITDNALGQQEQEKIKEDKQDGEQ